MDSTPLPPSIIKGAWRRGRPPKNKGKARVKFAAPTICYHRRAFIACVDGQCLALCGDCGQEELIC